MQVFSPTLRAHARLYVFLCVYHTSRSIQMCIILYTSFDSDRVGQQVLSLVGGVAQVVVSREDLGAP